MSSQLCQFQEVLLNSKFTIKELVDIDNIGRPDIMNNHYLSWEKKEFKGYRKNGSKIFKFRKIYVADSELKYLHIEIYKHLKSILKISDTSFAYKERHSAAMCASYHIGSYAIWAIDIKDFFPSITRGMIKNLYYNHISNSKYLIDGEDTANMLANILSTLCTINDIDNPRPEAFLPIGIEPSGIISNAILYDLDIDLSQYASSNGLVYSRYSDNIYISCKDKHIDDNFKKDIINSIETFEIDNNTPFKVNNNKSKYMPYWKRQKVLGVVINEKSNVDKHTINWLRSSLYHTYNDSLFLLNVSKTNSVNASVIKKELLKLKKIYQVNQGYLSYINNINPLKSEKYSSWVHATRINIKYINEAYNDC